MLLAGLMSGSLLADTETVRTQQSSIVSTEGNGEPSLSYTFDREPVYRVWQSGFGFSGFRQSSAYLPANDSLRPRLENARSEEHTSELQSRGHLVCRVLLQK